MVSIAILRYLVVSYLFYSPPPAPSPLSSSLFYSPPSAPIAAATIAHLLLSLSLPGMAYEAKIAFFDIGLSSGSNDILATPSNTDTDMFYPMYQAGARVISNSYG